MSKITDDQLHCILHVFKGQFDVVKLIFEAYKWKSIDLNVADLLGYSPFHITCYSGHVPRLAGFLEQTGCLFYLIFQSFTLFLSSVF